MPNRRQPQQQTLPNIDPEDDIVASPLRPGWLVGLATNVRGNVQLEKEVIEAEHIARNGAAVSVTQTKRIVHDPEEHKRANQARMKARAIICSVCAKCSFGLICPESEMDKLRVALKEAKRVVAAFNRTARMTRVEVHTVYGKVAQDDVTAVKAIKSELRSLIGEMMQGVKNCDVQKIRKAANDTRSVALTLSPQAAEAAKSALNAARSAARKVVAAGENAAVEIDREALRLLSTARTAFLDTDEEGEDGITAPEVTTRAVDLTPEEEAEAETPSEEPVARVRRGSAKRVARSAPKTGKAPKKASSGPKKRAARGGVEARA